MSGSKKVLVTGGAGYIGSHTVVSLFEAGYQPVVLDNFSNSDPLVMENLQQLLQHPVTLYQGDCCDLDFVDSLFSAEQLHGAIHFAASKAVGESVSKPLMYYNNNINSLLVLLEVMHRHKVPHLVFSSSCTVYGQPDQLPVTEASPRLPAASPYGNTKKICEDIIEDVVASQEPLKAVSLRYFNPIGAHPSAKIGELPLGTPNNLVPFVTQTAAGIHPKITVFGQDYSTPDGTCVRDYIHVMDLANAHSRAMKYLEEKLEKLVYDVFNIGTGQGTSVLQVLKTFEKVTGQQLNYEIGARRPGDVAQIYAAVDKAREVLKWEANQNLDQALYDAWIWQKTLSDKWPQAKAF